MPLNQTQKTFCLQNSAERIFQALTSASSTITIEDLRQFAAEKPEFATKMAIIEQRFASVPSPDEVRDYEVILTLVDPSALRAAMERYLDKWAHNMAAAEHVDDVRYRYRILKEAGDYEAIQNHTLNIATRTFAEKKENIEVMEQYLNDYSHPGGAPMEHVMNVEHWLRDAKSNFDREVSQMWDALFDDNRRLKSLDELKRFLDIARGYGNFSVEADNAAWEWAMTDDDVMSAVREYQEFVNNLGIHSGEVENLENLYRRWSRVNQADIFEVVEFANENPGLGFRKEVDDTIRGLLDDEIEKIVARPADYGKDEFLALYDAVPRDLKNVLLAAIGEPADDEKIIERLRNLDNIIRTKILKIPPVSEQGIAEGGASRTDIMFFGTTNSGKTCVLTGLFGNGRLHPDSADWCGRYALALQSYGEQQIAPPHTTLDYVAIVNCDITKSADCDDVVSFNLVDMAGEDLRRNITFIGNDIDPGEAKMAFSEMPAKVSSVICNDHDKVFFIIIDPTETSVLQTGVITTLLNLFGRPENADVMRRVRAIHFIVTKADTLQGNRLQAARQAVHRIIKQGDRDNLVRVCRRFGINSSGDEAKNGRPRIFPFSLGRFYPGNIYAGDGADSNVIINVLADYVVAMKADTPMRRLRRKLTTPLGS